MALLQTCKVTANIKRPDGSLVVGATVVAELNQQVTYEGIIVPRSVTTFTDENGTAVLNLWPNSLLLHTYTFYRIFIKWPNNHVETLTVRVLDNPTANIEDLVVKNIPADLSDDINRTLIALAELKNQAEEAEQKTEEMEQKAEKILQKIELTEDGQSKTLASIKDILDQIVAQKTEIADVAQRITAAKAELDQVEADTKTAENRVTDSTAQVAAEVAKIKTYTGLVTLAQTSVSITASNVRTIQDNCNEVLTEARKIKEYISQIYQNIRTQFPSDGSSKPIIVNIGAIFNFEATAGQKIFKGKDDNGLNLIYSIDTVLVYQNGILLRRGVDFTAVDGTSVTLVNAADKDDWISIIGTNENKKGGE